MEPWLHLTLVLNRHLSNPIHTINPNIQLSDQGQHMEPRVLCRHQGNVLRRLEDSLLPLLRDKCLRLKDNRHVPSSPQRQTPSSPQRYTPSTPQRHSYTLFPKEQPQPSTPRISVISDNGSIISHQSYNSQHRPRTSSLASSERSRSDSCMSVRLQPAANLSPSSSPTSSPKRPQTSPRMRTTSASSTQQTSVSEQPPSRWSGETVDMVLESPRSGRNAVDRTRDSSSSTLVATSPAWPTGSFFEDDEDEKLPLRQKVAQKLRSSRSSNALRSASNPTSNADQTHKKSPSWARRLVTWHRA
ncbi:hypothetical protein KCU76_g19582, partial [Aureobasidium melanogenum]